MVRIVLLYCLMIVLVFVGHVHAGDNDSLIQALQTQLIEAEHAQDSVVMAKVHRELGLAYMKGSYPKAYHHFQLSLTHTDSVRSQGSWADIHKKMGLAALRMGKFPEALSLYQKAQNTYEGLTDSCNLATISGMIAIVHNQTGNFNQAIGFSEKAIDYYRNTKCQSSARMDSINLAKAIIGLANTYNRLSNHEMSKKYYFEAIEIFSTLPHPDDLKNLQWVYINLGLIYKNEDNFARALEYYQKVLTISQEYGPRMLELGVLNSIGSLYVTQKDLSKALHFYEKSKAISEELGQKGELAMVLMNMGNVLKQLGDTSQALAHYFESLEIREETGSVFGMIRSHQVICRILLAQGKLDQAHGHLKSAQKLVEKTGDVVAIAHNHFISGYWALKKELYQEAANYCLKGLKIAEENSIRRHVRNNCRCLIDAHTQLGNYREAYVFQKRFMQAQDSLLNAEKVRDFTRRETQYEFEKEKEILALNQQTREKKLNSELTRQNLQRNLLLLGLIMGAFVIILLGRAFQLNRQKNRALAIQKTQLEHALDDRETLLKEIHHRVKNNLQVVSSLLSLQSRTIKDHSTRNALQEGRNRVKAMALIHQNLYQEENLIGVDLRSYIEKLTDSLIHSYRVDTEQISIKRQVASIPLDVDTIIPIGLILNELISNALKYAFKGRNEGEIAVKIDKTLEGLEINVWDNGVGLPEGFKIAKTRSLGFKLVQSFVKKMNAQLDIRSENGTAIRIFLPGIL